MAMTPLYALATVFLPNLVKLKGPATFVSMVESKDQPFFSSCWQQAGVPHTPVMVAQNRESSLSKGTYRIGVITLPTPQAMGEAFLYAVVVNRQNPHLNRTFTLDKEFVLQTGKERTQVVEREGNRAVKLGEGPALTDDAQKNCVAMIDAIMNVIEPQTLKKK